MNKQWEEALKTVLGCRDRASGVWQIWVHPFSRADTVGPWNQPDQGQMRQVQCLSRGGSGDDGPRGHWEDTELCDLLYLTFIFR